jgi:hypothetical protein
LLSSWKDVLGNGGRVVCHDCGSENASMNLICAYCGMPFTERRKRGRWKATGSAAIGGARGLLDIARRQRAPTGQGRQRMFASATVIAHLLRGAIGFGAIGAAVAWSSSHPWVLVAALPVALFALRGCPMCWTVGLVETIAARVRGRPSTARCVDGACAVTPPSREGQHSATSGAASGSE